MKIKLVISDVGDLHNLIEILEYHGYRCWREDDESNPAQKAHHIIIEIDKNCVTV